MHPDSRIDRVLRNWGVEHGSGTHVWVTQAFDCWKQFYGYFETMFEGYREDEALESLRRANGKRDFTSGFRTIHLSVLAGSPGAARKLITSEHPLSQEADQQEFNLAVARMHRAVGYSGGPTEERFLIAGVEFILAHGSEAMATTLVHSSLFRPDHVLHASNALRLGVPVEYVAHSRKDYTGEEIANFYHNNVPTEWTNVLGVFRSFKFATTASEIAQMHKSGVSIDYLSAYVKSAKHRPKEEQLPLTQVAQAWVEGIPIEYLLAGTA